MEVKVFNVYFLMLKKSARVNYFVDYGSHYEMQLEWKEDPFPTSSVWPPCDDWVMTRLVGFAKIRK